MQPLPLGAGWACGHGGWLGRWYEGDATPEAILVHIADNIEGVEKGLSILGKSAEIYLRILRANVENLNSPLFFLEIVAYKVIIILKTSLKSSRNA